MTERIEDKDSLADVLGGSWQGFVEQWCGGHPPGYEPSDAVGPCELLASCGPSQSQVTEVSIPRVV